MCTQIVFKIFAASNKNVFLAIATAQCKNVVTTAYSYYTYGLQIARASFIKLLLKNLDNVWICPVGFGRCYSIKADDV